MGWGQPHTPIAERDKGEDRLVAEVRRLGDQFGLQRVALTAQALELKSRVTN